MRNNLFAVIGRPILHSKSPVLHNYALKRSKIKGNYLRLAVESAAQAIFIAKEIGITGLNVTSPFKEEMFSLLENVDAAASKIKAVNTVVLQEEGFSGFNTDAVGIIEALQTQNIKLRGAKVLVLGAGGAARAAIASLMDCGAAVTVANRTAEKAQALAQEYSCDVTTFDVAALSKAVGDCSVIVNTLATTDEVIPAEILRANLTILESQYSATTALARDALQCGARVIDAREWLILQAAKSFEYFTGKSVDLKIFREGLENQNKPNLKRIALVGLMGAGKTTIAKLLAELLGAPWIEVDTLIVKAAGKEIRAIVEQDGEPAFRAFEKEALKKALAVEHAVISCGGGIIGDVENRNLLSEKTLCVWLWANTKELARRVGDDRTRPLLTGGNTETKLNDLMDTRLELYAEVSDLVVPTEKRTPAEIAERIFYEVATVTKH